MYRISAGIIHNKNTNDINYLYISDRWFVGKSRRLKSCFSLNGCGNYSGSSVTLVGSCSKGGFTLSNPQRKTSYIPKMIEPVYNSKDMDKAVQEDDFAYGEYTFYDETLPDGKKDSPSAAGSIICGVLALVLCLLPVVPLVLGIASVILSRENERQVMDRREYNTGTGRAGNLCGTIAIIINVAVYITILAIPIIGMIIS